MEAAAAPEAVNTPGRLPGTPFSERRSCSAGASYTSPSSLFKNSKY